MTDSPTPRNSSPKAAVTAPAIAGWIADSAKRHSITLLASALVIVAADLLGAAVDSRTYFVLGAWLGVTWLAGPWAARPTTHAARLQRYASTLVIDVLFLGATYYYIDGAQYLGVVFFAQMALIARATLPRRWAVGISVLILGVYATLVLLITNGLGLQSSPIGAASLAGNQLFAVAAIASALGMVVLLMHLQSRLMRSIRDAEMRYVTLVQSASDMVMTFDQDGRFLDANPATLQQSGYSWDDLKRLPTMGFFNQAGWPAVVGAFRKTLGGESQRLEVRYIRADGSERWVQGASSPLTLDDRPAVVLIARDITDAHRQAEALREKDSVLSMVLDSLNAGFIAFDKEFRVTAAFGDWARVREANGEQLLGRQVRELANADVVLAQHAEAIQLMQQGEVASVSWILDGSDGQRRMRSTLVPLRGPGGEMVGGAGLWVDETDLASAEQEREQLRARMADVDHMESLGKLVSGVAHELNNPLAAILNFTEDLLAETRSPDERLALEVIQAQALRSRTIVRDLLTYARRDIERPRAPVVPGPVLETLARAMRPGFAAQAVNFTVELTDATEPMMLDRAGFEQVVTNLLTNAAHAAGSGGSVRLSSRMRHEQFEVVVEDNGAGIAADAASRMFEPFFTTKPTGQGVGLGLSVSTGIARAHSGTLVGENRPATAGGGARFVLRIPIDRMAAELVARRQNPPPAGSPSLPVGTVGRAAVEEPASTPRAMPVRKPTLLIIDDESAIRQGLKRYFTRRGWAVEESADGADALSKLLRPEAVRIYDVVLCDLKMAGVSGMDVYDRVLNTMPQVARRFILTTGDTSAPDVSGFLAQVTAPVLDKPFELVALEALAEEVRRGAGAPAVLNGVPGPP